MRLLALADIDASYWQWGQGRADVLVSCGDVPDQLIIEAAGAYNCAKIFAVKGNHDPSGRFREPIVDLHLRSEQHGGVVFAGLNGSWRYKPKGNYLYDQYEVVQFLAAFPPVDVFVSHNSPRGIHDQEDEVHYGFEGLNGYITRTRPQILLHGHQHVNQETDAAGTKVIGVCGHRLLELPAP